MAGDHDIVLGDRQRFAGGDAQLQLHEVEPGDRLGDGVLHLESGVDLEERDRAVGADHELDGAGALVADVTGERDGTVAERGTDLGGDARGGRLLDDLLIPPLDRALALAQVHHVAVRVADDLHLDVTAALEVRLDEHRSVTERGQRLARRCGDGVVEIVRRGGRLASPDRRRRRPPSRAPDRSRVASSAMRPSTTSIIGVVGTPASIAARLAATLSPSNVTCSGVGPTQTSPASMTACAKAAFSARNP